MVGVVSWGRLFVDLAATPAWLRSGEFSAQPDWMNYLKFLMCFGAT